jgi:parallel beta-helix repeat protein
VDSQGNPDFHHPVRNVTVANLRVTGFSQGVGVDGFNTKGYHVKRVYADHNGGYGIARFASTNSVFENNHASFNGEAGLYMGDSPNGNSIMRDNVADHNGFGIFMRDSTRLAAVHNTVFGNCMGIFALNTGHGAPFDTPAGDYLITNNKVIANNKACPASDEGGALSGIGIGLAGVHNTLVKHNTVLFNRPSGPTEFSGGILLVSTKADGGSDPNFNTVVHNTAKHNKPADIFSDGTGKGNKIKRNNCNVAIPGNRGFCSR